MLRSVCIAAVLAIDPATQRAASLASFPRQVLWAWERPEDLRFVDPSRTGVAFLAGTLVLSSRGVAVLPRRQPLLVPEGAAMMAVVRIEVRGHPSLESGRRAEALRAVEHLLRADSVRALQIDFDATTSQRSFYRDLLSDLRRALPALPISITALGSWCAGDPWIRSLPIDEAVPMLFRMGPDAEAIRVIFGRAKGEAPCEGSIGLSLDEPSVRALGRRVYWFAPRSWSAGDVPPPEEVSR